MTRQTIKNQINKILSDNSKGIFSDECWEPINNIWKALTAAGFDYTIWDCHYSDRALNNLDTGKRWKFFITLEKGKPIYGVIYAAGCGTLNDPLCKYDITAYVN